MSAYRIRNLSPRTPATMGPHDEVVAVAAASRRRGGITPACAGAGGSGSNPAARRTREVVRAALPGAHRPRGRASPARIAVAPTRENQQHLVARRRDLLLP